jgi:hypothetical protein
MSSVNPDNNLIPADIVSLARVKAMTQRAMRTYVGVSNAMRGRRDDRFHRGTDRSLNTYQRDRRDGGQVGHLLPHPAPPTNAAGCCSAAQPALSGAADDRQCEALASAYEQAVRAVRRSDSVVVDIRVSVGNHRHPAAPTTGSSANPGSGAEPAADELLPTLRWLLTQSAGAIADAAHRLETRAADVDDAARAQLADDLRVLDEEVATLKALLAPPIDWDADMERLLRGEVPGCQDDAD